ncbi:MAG: type 4a pilus biogenesis protein PilO [Candidatus Omnitrophica bacterium]|nr:type 4a pilus biogenesis protein PilO [Candidatus Omnitrophota bacterium]
MKLLNSLQTFFLRLSKREKLIFYITLGVILMLVFKLLLIEPALTKMSEQDKEIADKKKIIKLDLRLLAIKDKVEEESKKYEGFLMQAGSAEEEVVLMQKEIQRLADEAGLYVGNIRPGEVEEKGFFQTYLINVNCEGEMPQIVDFLYGLETSAVLLTVERYTITPKNENSSVAVCRLVVSKTAAH